ncbi:IclR family transcriptional regulator [Streptomyces sp. DSM 42041]|uniref:IclR family transcriptional regulator n=1 Tax=Streptomyces hazeniae TaxID=3075538 RepID=A0ABU2NMJ4_9ACTN|nr:IclR family transcriptional regulator [Streptomyces sp. DSM 42041]MDT0378195.1 IclR family transcriptional regulator [Streptomyces sp. DSM 42041]
MPGAPRSSSFARGLNVLAAVVDGGPQRADEVAARTGLSTSSVYRFVRRLVDDGFLEADGHGTYRVGPRLSRLQDGPGTGQTLRSLALPFLRDLVSETSETVLLTVPAGLSALVVESLDSPHSMRLSFAPGTLRPLHAGASAKALLAFAPQDVIDRVLGGRLERFTPGTPAKATLRTQLARIREQGYVVSRGEVDPHAVAIGVPVLPRGRLACALSIAGPEHRFDGNRAHTEVRALTAAARALASRIEDSARTLPAPPYSTT